MRQGAWLRRFRQLHERYRIAAERSRGIVTRSDNALISVIALGTALRPRKGVVRTRILWVISFRGAAADFDASVSWPFSREPSRVDAL